MIKNGIKLTAAFLMAIGCLMGSKSFTKTATAQVLIECKCGQSDCSSCQTECGCGEASCTKGCRAPAPRIASAAVGAVRAVGGTAKRVVGRVGSRRSCGTCQSDCGCVQCPSCEGDICKLELDNGKAKKSCFKVEQKVVCIPPVRLPWQKCCPPGQSRKTRTINVLKKHTYECPSCSYKWSLQEPEVAQPTVGTMDSTPPVSPQDADWYVPSSGASAVQGTMVPAKK
ncbi:MAG: hypothetical protein AB8B55_01955 [Mariniblastus sp.]